MPGYKFVCKNHKPARETIRYTLKPWKKLLWDAQDHLLTCIECGEKMVRDPKPPSATMHETLDNGVMTRKVERFRGAEQMYKDRAKKNG